MTLEKRSAVARRIGYRQGAKTVYIEPRDDAWSVRYNQADKASVQRVLKAYGQTSDLANQQTMVVELSNPAQSEELQNKLQQLSEEGAVAAVAPVLRDPDSQMNQIVTDEISVRFTQVPSAQQLKNVEREYGVTVARQNEFVPNQFILKTEQPNGLDTLEIASKLDKADGVEFATPNFISEYRR
jgi:hypothetical protein